MAAAASHAKTMNVPLELKTLLKEYPALRVDEKKGKVCCCLTGHEMPLRVDAVRSFVQGKKFLKAQAQREYDFDQHRPHLVPNTKKGFQHTLFCTLTLRCVTKRPADVARHVNGKRYQRALKRWKKCQETGEKFKPRGGRRQRGSSIGRKDDSASDQDSARNFWDSSSGEEDHDTDEDDLNDLYPSEDFASASDEEEGKMENAAKDAVGSKEESGDSDSEAADADVQKVVNGSSSHKAVKRKKPQKPGGKRRRS